MEIVSNNSITNFAIEPIPVPILLKSFEITDGHRVKDETNIKMSLNGTHIDRMQKKKSLIDFPQTKKIF